MFSTANTLPRTYAIATEIQTNVADEDDLDDFDALVQKYQGVVYRQALWLLGDETAAEDAAQEAFCRAFFKIHTYRGPSFRAWILRITTNYCLDQLRKRKSRVFVQLDTRDQMESEEMQTIPGLAANQPTVEEIVERGELMTMINQGLRSLLPEDRLPILLVDFQEVAYQEAAAIMGISLGTFKSRLSRARAKLLGLLMQPLPGQTIPFMS